VPVSVMHNIDQFENSTFVDAVSILDDTGITCGNRDLQASVMYPPTKRHKLYVFLVHHIYLVV
jgi:hypothetical protein